MTSTPQTQNNGDRDATHDSSGAGLAARRMAGHVLEASSRQANIAQAPRLPGPGDDPSGTPPNDKALLGETIDPAQAPTYLNARSTSTNTSNGRFIAVDPAVTKTRDPYIYSSGNPIRRSDPTGLWD